MHHCEVSHLNPVPLTAPLYFALTGVPFQQTRRDAYSLSKWILRALILIRIFSSCAKRHFYFSFFPPVPLTQKPAFMVRIF